MSKLSNELLMLKYLNNGRKYSLNELAEYLEVSKRMVRTYKEDMEKAGIFIETIKGPYGGYILRNYSYLPSGVFTEEDVALLERTNTKKNLTNIIKKVKSLTLENKTPLDTKSSTYKIISKAIKEKRKVKITYYTEGKGRKERVIHPFHIIYYGDSFGCAAYCETKQDLRHFTFNRMEKIELLNEYYE